MDLYLTKTFQCLVLVHKDTKFCLILYGRFNINKRKGRKLHLDFLEGKAEVRFFTLWFYQTRIKIKRKKIKQNYTDNRILPLYETRMNDLKEKVLCYT